MSAWITKEYDCTIIITVLCMLFSTLKIGKMQSLVFQLQRVGYQSLEGLKFLKPAFHLQEMQVKK